MSSPLLAGHLLGRTACVVVAGILLLVAAPDLYAQLAVGLTPAAGFYGEIAPVPETVGFEGQIHIDWQPPFIPLPGLGVTAIGGVSTIAGQSVGGRDVNTVGFFLGAGALYELFIGPLGLRPGLYAGIQYSTFDGVDADDEVPIMLQPHLEAGYTLPFGLSVGVYLGYKLLFYDTPETSLTIGPRFRYVFR